MPAIRLKLLLKWQSIDVQSLIKACFFPPTNQWLELDKVIAQKDVVWMQIKPTAEEEKKLTSNSDDPGDLSYELWVLTVISSNHAFKGRIGLIRLNFKCWIRSGQKKRSLLSEIKGMHMGDPPSYFGIGFYFNGANVATIASYKLLINVRGRFGDKIVKVWAKPSPENLIEKASDRPSCDFTE